MRPATASDGPEPNIEAIGAPAVWRSGHTGEGIVVGSIDTGVSLQPDLVKKYRGYTGAGSAANDDYNWFDAVTRCVGPCDRNGHGTHTVGTMVGSNDTHQVGVAPGAQWIACRALNDGGSGTIDFVLKCMEFMLAPTNRSGQNADPSKAPDVVNNSYGSGATTAMNSALDALYAADIMMIAANGNTGPRCGSGGSPAVSDKVVAVGATKQNGNLPPAPGSDAIASFSSRGPGPSNITKPDLVAPGVDIVSLNLSRGYTALSGTSMAAPHVAGAVALLWSARPGLRGNIPATYNALAQTADRLAGTSCGTNPGAIPNDTYGWGFIRVEKAVAATGSRP
jgi:subtilisin family serine protease